MSKNLNPYVTLDVIPSEKNTKKKTKTVKDNSSPEFNERSLINFKYEKNFNLTKLYLFKQV